MTREIQVRAQQLMIRTARNWCVKPRYFEQLDWEFSVSFHEVAAISNRGAAD
jgi:hypothetical protein